MEEATKKDDICRNHKNWNQRMAMGMSTANMYIYV